MEQGEAGPSELLFTESFCIGRSPECEVWIDSGLVSRVHAEVFFEAVRGSGGTARLVLLPHEDHGYRAVESIEHVLWEQITWFDRYVKNAGPRTPPSAGERRASE